MRLARTSGRTLSTVAAAVLCGVFLQAPAHGADARELAASIEARVIDWRRDIHAHPELSNREVRTAKLVADHLESLGLEVHTGIAHTGVTGFLRGGAPGPTIALRADMDALPVTEETDVPFRSTATAEYRGETVGVMHACGHDAHTAILMGVAELLAARREELAGNVLFVFQPAEEGAPEGEEGGAAMMLREGVFETHTPEAAFALHVTSLLHTGEIGFRSGPLMAASDSWRIVVQGRQTHGARPWLGVDPIVVSSGIINALQTIVSRQVDLASNPAVLTVGVIEGGVRHNIIPDTVEMRGTLRTFDRRQREDILERMRLTVDHVAQASGAAATLEMLGPGNPVTYNEPDLAQRAVPSIEKVVGERNARRIPLVTGAEDFAYIAAAVPSFYFFVGVTPPSQDLASAASNHSPRFHVDEDGLAIGVAALTQIALDYLSPAPE